MKQPELGRKISELRKTRGLTQEELVEKCNISVRTIQRIETGEVTPRSYTVKTILAALEYDLQDIAISDNKIFRWFKSLMLIDVNTDKPSNFLNKQLKLALLFGILYFLIEFIAGPADYIRFEENRLIYSQSVYILIKLFSLASFIIFYRGFVLIGSLVKNYLLKIISIIFIGSAILVIGFDIFSIFNDSIDRESFLYGAALARGGIGIIFGVSLNRLQKYLGKISKFAGVFEIIAACFFLTVILSFIGFIVLIPAELFEIILIYKMIELIKTKETGNNFA